MSDEYRVFYSRGVKIIVYKGKMLAANQYRSLSLIQKLTAILGLSQTLDYCHKHRLFFRKYESGRINEIWVCPKCFDEKVKIFEEKWCNANT